jgi:hypothetical protein
VFFTVHNTSSGNLLDITSNTPDGLSPEYSVKGWDMDVPDLYYYEWSPITLSFTNKVNVDRIMTVHQFLNRFTAQERIAIKDFAKTNPAVADYMDMLNSASFVDPDGLETFGGLYYLTLLGLIAPGRMYEIVA